MRLTLTRKLPKKEFGKFEQQIRFTIIEIRPISSRNDYYICIRTSYPYGISRDQLVRICFWDFQ